MGGILLVGLATALYLERRWAQGRAPDRLMLGVARRVRARIGVVRTWLEASATLVGFAMGGTVGIGTLAFALIGPAIELSFALLRRSALVAQRVS